MKWKVLVVEDEPGIWQFLQEGLEEEGFEVAVATDGVQASELIFRFHPDLILLDWMLPEKSGMEVLQEFRAINQETPVIFLTAKDTLDDTLAGFKIGANDYLKKPFHFEELLQRISVQLRHKEPKAELTLGSIRMHLKRFQVFKKEDEIALTNKEFQLLTYLIENKNKVCSRVEILEKVWDIHFDYDASILDVYMNSLRKKLKLSPDENWLQTVRGVGFIAKD